MKFSTRKIHVKIPIDRGIFYLSRFTEGIRLYNEDGERVFVNRKLLEDGFEYCGVQFAETVRPETARVLLAMMKNKEDRYLSELLEPGRYYCDDCIFRSWHDIEEYLWRYQSLCEIFEEE